MSFVPEDPENRVVRIIYPNAKTEIWDHVRKERYTITNPGKKIALILDSILITEKKPFCAYCLLEEHYYTIVRCEDTIWKGHTFAVCPRDFIFCYEPEYIKFKEEEEEDIEQVIPVKKNINDRWKLEL